MKRRQRQSLSLNIILILVAALLGVTENFAANQPGSLLSQVLQRGALPVLGFLIVIMVIGQLIAFRLDNPAMPSRKWDPAQTPYPGLEPFGEEDAAVFFGRDRSISELVHRLHSERTDSSERFVVLAGASGSGKSSLIQAGLIPRLRARRWIVLPVITPGSNPLNSLAGAFGELADPPELTPESYALAALIGSLRRREGRRFSRMILVVDQLEELFTLSGKHERELFLDLLDTAIAADTKFWVVAPVRMEYLREFLDTSHASFFSRPMALGAIARVDLSSVIEGPATLARMSFEPGLVPRIVEDTETSDALPLLAYLLQELYFVSGYGKTATFEDYDRLGGVTGALARQADEVVSRLQLKASMEFILRVLLQFVTIDSGHAARRRVPLDGFAEAEREVVDAFIDARLLVSDRAGNNTVAQVAHEALFRHWGPLRQEVQDRAEHLRQRAELERWTADWQSSSRKSDYLLTGERLRLAVAWLDSLGDQAPDTVRDFIAHSRNHDLATLRTVSESISQYVLANVDQNPDSALMLALAALTECPPTPAAQRALLAALAFNHLANVLDGHTDEVWRLSWSPDACYLATASLDGTCRIWDASTGDCTAVLSGHTGTVEAVAWSPDSRSLATTSRDQSIRLWTLAGEPITRLNHKADVIRAVAWSPDGNLIASGSDEVVRIWDVRSRMPIHELKGHTDNVFGVAFCPNGDKIMSCSHDRTVRIWDLNSHACLELRGHTDIIEGVAWAPDSKRVVSVSADKSTRVWDTSSGDQQLLILGHTDRIWNVAWSPDGQYIATCGADRTARIWDANNGAEILTLRGHASHVFDIAWSPTGSELATASADKTVRMWSVNARGGEAVSFIGHIGPVRSVIPLLSRPDRRKLIASCGDDHTIRIWEATGELVNVLLGHTDSVLSIANASELLSCSSDRTIRCWDHIASRISTVFVVDCDGGIPEAVAMGDGSRFATGGRDRLVKIWDSTNGSPVAAMTGHLELIAGLTWSPSGAYLASASDDRTVRIWEISSFREIAAMYGHDSWVDSVSWSPDEQFIVTGSEDRSARVWEVKSREQIAVLSGHQDRVRSVAWSPDGTRIATGSYDSTVRIWDAQNYIEIGVIGVHRDKVTSVAWTLDGRQVISGSYDGTLRVWNADVDLDSLVQRARARIFGSLSDDERRAHLLPVTDQ